MIQDIFEIIFYHSDIDTIKKLCFLDHQSYQYVQNNHLWINHINYLNRTPLIPQKTLKGWLSVCDYEALSKHEKVAFIIANTCVIDCYDLFINLNKNIKNIRTSKEITIVNQLYQSLQLGKKIKIDTITIVHFQCNDIDSFIRRQRMHSIIIINYSDIINSRYILNKINEWFVYADINTAYVKNKNIKKVLYQIFDYYPNIQYEIL